jgi:hypothetical protein
MKRVLIIPILLILSCTSIHYISRESLLSQIKASADTVFMLGHRNGIIKAKNSRGVFAFEESDLDSEMLYNILSSGNKQNYWFNLQNINQIICKNRMNEDVSIGVDHNSQLIFIDSLNHKTQMYFQPTTYYDGLFIGYRSVLLRIRNKIDYNKIKQIQIYSEIQGDKKIH